jgi:hypothetical protein
MFIRPGNSPGDEESRQEAGQNVLLLRAFLQHEKGLKS